MNFPKIFSFNRVLGVLAGDTCPLKPFAQENTDSSTGVPDTAAEMGFNGQIGNIEDPTENRGVSGIQLKRSFYNIFFRELTSALPVLVGVMRDLYQFFIRDYCMNDRKYAEELKDYYKNGDVIYKDIEGRFLHQQRASEGWNDLTLLHDRGKTVLGYPSIWPGTTIPSWAIDIGSHGTYSWSDYSVLKNDFFKSFLTATSDFGASFDDDGFTSPDLRGMSPAIWNTAGSFLASGAGQHLHVWGSTSISTDSKSPTHGHSGTWTHTTHNHTCNKRLFSTGGSGGISLSGWKKAWSKTVNGVPPCTTENGDHSHGVSIGNGTEKHYHTTQSCTPTVSTTPSANAGTVSRVNTYPVSLIVRVV